VSSRNNGCFDGRNSRNSATAAAWDFCGLNDRERGLVHVPSGV